MSLKPIKITNDSQVSGAGETHKEKPNIIDCDRHVTEPVDMWREYTEKQVFDQMPVQLAFDTDAKRLYRVQAGHIDIGLPPTYVVGDHPILSHWDESQQIASALRYEASIKERKSAVQPSGQIAAMDDTHISKAFIFPTFAGYVTNHKDIDAKTSLAYTRGYNRWLFDYCGYNPERLKGVGLISRHDPATLVSQVEAVVKRGWSTITIRPEPIAGKLLGDPSYELFWQACAYHNVTIAFHGGAHLQGATVGMDRFSSRFALNACSHPMEAQMAFITLLESGVFERHPKLRCAFLEAGCAWVPHWLWRLDNICYNEYPSLTKDTIKMLPSAYFKRHCWVAMEIGEPLKDVLDTLGHEKLIFGSDYPHPDHLHFDLANIANTLPELTAKQLSDILEENPKALFSL